MARTVELLVPDLGDFSDVEVIEVEDVDETIKEYQENGAELIIQQPGSWAYFRTGGPDGTVVEISQHQVEHEREVVQD